ncbi:MAG: hypothetical protein AAF726_22340 [Planctomycetota bacterium]
MGSLEGVVGTRSAWIGKHEVVEVAYRPDVVGYGKLIDAAVEHGCASRVWTTSEEQLGVAKKDGRIAARVEAFAGGLRPAKASDQLYYLERSPLRYLPLTPVQARRVNGALYTKKDPGAWLSPRQKELFRAIESTLAERPKALEGLERPASIEKLAKYSDDLSKALAAGPR